MEQLKGILFIDIETVPVVQQYTELTEPMQKEWLRKARTIKSEEVQADLTKAFENKAGVYSEFAKVVCIGIGSIAENGGSFSIRLKSLTGHNEKDLLVEFAETLSRFARFFPDFRFCGHNIKEFDIPFLSRRFLINGAKLPPSMQHQGKKPWEIPHLDTLEMWRFGDFKNYTSLSLLAAVLGIPSPKDDIDGSKVGEVYWHESNLERIAKYCLQDVLTSAKVYLRLLGVTDIHLEPVIVKE